MLSLGKSGIAAAPFRTINCLLTAVGGGYRGRGLDTKRIHVHLNLHLHGGQLLLQTLFAGSGGIVLTQQVKLGLQAGLFGYHVLVVLGLPCLTECGNLGAGQSYLGAECGLEVIGLLNGLDLVLVTLL